MAGKRKKLNICTGKEKLWKLLEFCASKFEKIERYCLADCTISKIIEQASENDKIEDVLAKVVLINSLYGTAIFDVIKIAKHIQLKGEGIDNKIKKGDLSVIDVIRKYHGIKTQNDKERNLYSFATKYVSSHAPEKYPIYDNLVERLLRELNHTHKFYNPFTKEALKDYKTLKLVIDSLIKYLGSGEDYKYKKIDQALWLYAKYLYKHNELDKDIANAIDKYSEVGC